MKYLGILICIVLLTLSAACSSEAVTVYFKDGSSLEVEKATRIGDTVCLFVPISDIDTTKTTLTSPLEPHAQQPGGLAVFNVDFAPAEEDGEIIATGQVANNSSETVQHVKVTLILQDKEGTTLTTHQKRVSPDTLLPGQVGTYRLRLQKPQGFWKASIEVQGDALASQLPQQESQGE